jgi:hypothetical protein
MEYPMNIVNFDIDTIRYRVQVQRTLTQEDVRLSVDVTALVSTAGNDRRDLDPQIRMALRRFLDAEWKYSTVKRAGDAVGYERVMLHANTRVPPDAVWNLEERARAASREGLALSNPKVYYSLPASKVSVELQRLRIEVIEEVRAQIPEFERTTGRPWRIGAIHFGIPDDSYHAQSSKGAYRSAGIGDLEDDEVALAGSERITLIAEVVLKGSVATPCAEAA